MGFGNTWGITSPSQMKAQAKYDAKNTIRVSMKLNRKTDCDIIQWLERQGNMQGAIKKLIRSDLQCRKGDTADALKAAGKQTVI